MLVMGEVGGFIAVTERKRKGRGKIGHKHDKCEAKCHLCASYNHFPGSCQGQAISKKQKRRLEYRKRQKIKLMLEKSNSPDGKHLTESLSDADTLADQEEDPTGSMSDTDTMVDVEEDSDTTLDSQQGDAEERQGDSIKKASEVIKGVPVQQISAAVESIKKAKYTDNTGLCL